MPRAATLFAWSKKVEASWSLYCSLNVDVLVAAVPDSGGALGKYMIRVPVSLQPKICAMSRY